MRAVMRFKCDSLWKGHEKKAQAMRCMRLMAATLRRLRDLSSVAA